VPGIFDKIARAKWIRLQALDRNGRQFELEADGLLSVCIQHEMDHLKGIVFVEYLSRLKQTRILSRLRKQEKQQRRAL
jgi:peptide deformylase